MDPTDDLWMSERGMWFTNPRYSDDPGPMYRNTEQLRLKDEALFLIDPRPGLRTLELGCGDGLQMVYLGLLGCEVHGIDWNPGLVETANEKLTRIGAAGSAVTGDARKLDHPDSSFDVICSFDFHEHLAAADQAAMLREAWRVLKPSGRLIIKTPNLAYLRVSLQVRRLSALAHGRNPFAVHIEHTPGTPQPEHIGLTSIAKMRTQLEAAGFDNYVFAYPPLRRGRLTALGRRLMEVPMLRDIVCQELVVGARKPIAAGLFPN